MDLDLRQLRVFAALLNEHSLSRAAEVLDVSQPALSKTLAGLREQFGDPLFIRVGHRMEPTSKALELEPPVRAILDQLTTLRALHVPFDPASSSRTFTFSVVDAGMTKILPPLIRYIHRHAPNVRLQLVPLDVDRLETSLESGRIDFAMGSYASLSKRIRRQTLWSASYVSVVRRDHPRITSRPSLKAFAAEKHVLVSTAGTGHAHQQAERALERAIPSGNVICRVPTFLAAGIVASETDAVVTVPRAMAESLAPRLALRIFAPPLKLPRIEISQHWHERFHREPGNQWIRRVFAELFATQRG
ncbi:MAG: LysR family transcriptional regulator [Gammaproteobacteria bacterium]|nr:LysR family transcriptional regulator [Gammaproteobacteria bacterium]